MNHMKIVFVSAYFSHHQFALSEALWRQTKGNYVFIETKEMTEERVALGYPSRQTEYTLKYGEQKQLAQQKIMDADVVIAGSAPEYLLRQRIQAGKLLLRYSERPLKKGLEPLKFLPRLLRWHWRNPRKKPIYMLCASGYTAGDYGKFSLFRNKTFQWGYFPETRRYEDIHKLMDSKEPAQLLWCGRFLDWKHPEDALKAAQRLKAEDYRFNLQFIGGGEWEGQLRQLAEEYGLHDCVQFLGPRKPEQVREYMERAGIYLFTSDRQEGWGAVLNEAMNSGCTVVASHAIGGVPFLVRDGENGMVYPSGDVDALFKKIRYLLEHPEQQRRMGMAAYETIVSTWNAETAAERLITLSEHLLAGKNGIPLFADGPCSRAEAIQEDWSGK